METPVDFILTGDDVSTLTRLTARARMTRRWQAAYALGIATREETRRVLVSLGYSDEQVSRRLHVAERIAYRTLARGREPHIR